MFKAQRRRADAQGVPVRLVINYVGISLLVLLATSAWMSINGMDATAILGLAGSCVTGLLALLGRTQPVEPQQPTGTPSDPVNITASPGDPVPVVETPAVPVAAATTGAADLADVPQMEPDGEDDGNADALAAAAIAEQEKGAVS